MLAHRNAPKWFDTIEAAARATEVQHPKFSESGSPDARQLLKWGRSADARNRIGTNHSHPKASNPQHSKMRLNRTALLPYYFLLLFLLLVVLSLLSSLNDPKSPEPGSNALLEKELSQRLIAIQQQLNNFELMNKRRKSEIFYLQKLVQQLSNKTNETTLLNDFNLILNHKVTNLSTNLNFLDNVHTMNSNYLNLPTIKELLPYLDHNLSSLDPAYVHPTKRIRQDVEIVFGIPTVRRPREAYLISTIKNLIDNLDETGRNSSLFVIMIAEVKSLGDAHQAVT